MADSIVVKKKVKAYPIQATLRNDLESVSGWIVKLTQQGFLAEIVTCHWQPGERLECVFELPVFHVQLAESVTIVKLYAHWNTCSHPFPAAEAEARTMPSPAVAGPVGVPKSVPQGGVDKKMVHLIEMHFTPLSLKGRERISTFLRALHTKTA